jgi:hypothetical protein
LPESDREVLLDLLLLEQQVVSLAQPDWRQQVTAALAEGGSVRLRAAREEREALKTAVLELVTVPLEVGFLHLYPQVRGVEQDWDGLAVTLYLPEAVQ